MTPNTVRKTLDLSTSLLEKVQKVIDQAAEYDIQVTETFVLRLAIAQGLPKAAQFFGVEVEPANENPQSARIPSY